MFQESDLPEDAIRRNLEIFLSPSYRGAFPPDPGDYIRRAKTPMLKIFAGDDQRTPTRASVNRLLEMNDAKEIGPITLTVLPGLNHLLRETGTEPVATEGPPPDSPLSKAVTEHLSCWIEGRVQARASGRHEQAKRRAP